MTTWRWDQGHIQYFMYDNIKSAAKALLLLNGTQVPGKNQPDVVREVLSKHSSLPFKAPNTHKVWRQYKRVFGCALLATEKDGQIVTTEVCKALAEDVLVAEDYFHLLATRIYFPGPMFVGYSSTEPRVWPFCAIIKFLIARHKNGAAARCTVAEIFSFIKGNGATGKEGLGFYLGLTATAVKPTTDENRQVREALPVISQLSFLKWEKPYLALDIGAEDADTLFAALSPESLKRHADATKELLALGRTATTSAITLSIKGMDPIDQEFSEGKKTRITHLRVERSRKLREAYFKSNPMAHICHMCSADTQERYPWAGRVVEVHHLLPLSSAVRINDKNTKTSLKDVVGLCPSCHKATHQYYSKWLKKEGKEDFNGVAEARAIYAVVKGEYKT